MQQKLGILSFMLILNRCGSYLLTSCKPSLAAAINPVKTATRSYCFQNFVQQRTKRAMPSVSCLKPNAQDTISAHEIEWSSDLPRAEMDCWRPTVDDVDRISWGKPAKKKTTGSRGVPHRLNEEERKLYDFARQKGFLEIPGSGWRKERRGAPLLNTYRNW